MRHNVTVLTRSGTMPYSPAQSTIPYAYESNLLTLKLCKECQVIHNSNQYKLLKNTEQLMANG